LLEQNALFTISACRCIYKSFAARVTETREILFSFKRVTAVLGVGNERGENKNRETGRFPRKNNIIMMARQLLESYNIIFKALLSTINKQFREYCTKRQRRRRRRRRGVLRAVTLYIHNIIIASVYRRT